MKFILSFALLFSVLACNSENPVAKQKRDDFKTELEAYTGDKYTVAKSNTDVPGYVVFKNETTGKYVAYNVERRNSVITFEQYIAEGNAVHNLGVTTRENGMLTETIYVYGGLTFANAEGPSRDLELIGSLKEEAAKTYLTVKLATEFSLSSDRASELANLVIRHKRLENSRALTPSEKDRFALKALGVSMTSVEKALKKKMNGDEAAYLEMLEKAAEVNKTTPEQVGRFFDLMGGVEI